MKPEEHALMVEMFALQFLFIKSLVTLLGSRGILQADDVLAYTSLTFSDERKDLRLLRKVADIYTEAASKYGLKLKPHFPSQR